MEREQVVGTSDFGCRMAFESHARVHRRHAAAVVDYLYHGAPRVLDIYLYDGRACIDSIFHKLFYHGSRALDHLARRYLVCHRVRQQLHYIFHRVILVNNAEPRIRVPPVGLLPARFPMQRY